MKVNIHSAESWERGFYLVLTASGKPDWAVALTLENGSDMETIITRVKNAFATLENGISQIGEAA